MAKKVQALVKLPTLVLFGTFDPDSIPNFFLINTGTGGVFVMNVNDLSW